MRKIFPFELFHLGGDEVHTGQYEWFSSCNIPKINLILKLKLLDKGLKIYIFLSLLQFKVINAI